MFPKRRGASGFCWVPNPVPIRVPKIFQDASRLISKKISKNGPRTVPKLSKNLPRIYQDSPCKLAVTTFLETMSLRLRFHGCAARIHAAARVAGNLDPSMGGSKHYSKLRVRCPSKGWSKKNIFNYPRTLQTQSSRVLPNFHAVRPMRSCRDLRCYSRRNSVSHHTVKKCCTQPASVSAR